MFALPCQLALVIDVFVSPLDYACCGIHITFILIEVVLIIRAIQRSIKKQAAVFHLRNSATKTFTTESVIKTSHEIEEELFFNFPHLRDKYSVSRNVSQVDSNSNSNYYDTGSKKDI